MGAESVALNLNSSHSEFKNNIFSIATLGTPVFIHPSANNYSFDFNNYYHPEGLIGKHNDVNYYELEEWGNAIHGDANSRDVAPYFVSETDPLPYQRDFNGAAIPIPGILLDINGLIRNDQAPDIGAREFMVDFGVTQLVSPNLECTHGTADSVIVFLRQFGDIPFKDLRLAYRVNNGPVVTDMIPGTIYNDLYYTFKTPVNMSTTGEYVFKIWLISTRDDNQNNDTLIATRYTKPAPVVNFEYDNTCSGREVRFSGNATVQSPYIIANYEWLFGDNETSPQQNPVHIFAQSGSYEVTLRAYSDAGCYNETSRTITLSDYEKMAFNLQKTDEKCGGTCDGQISINLTGGQSPLNWYLNSVSQTTQTFNNLCSGEYILRATDDKGCEITETITIQPSSPLTVDASGSPERGYAPLQVQLSGQVTGTDLYEWIYRGETIGESQNLTYLVEHAGDEFIILRANSGKPNFCTEQDTVFFKVDFAVNIFIPNAFTPNNDGFNDTFGPVTTGLRTLEMKIIDRNGRLVHTIQKPDGRWDGKLPSGSEAPQGMYYYTMTSQGYDDLPYDRQGSVTLLRDIIDMTPNPVKSIAVLDLSGFSSPGLKAITILSASGNVVRSWQTSETVVEMDLSALTPGLWLLQVVSADRFETIKFIKE